MNEEVKNYAAKWFNKGREWGNFPMTKETLAELEKEGGEICQLFSKSPDNPDGYEVKTFAGYRKENLGTIKAKEYEERNRQIETEQGESGVVDIGEPKPDEA